MGKQYCLPLVAMVEIMQSSPSRVLLQSQLASLPGVSKKKCLAQIVLERGVVRACTIWGEAGALLLEDRKAYEALANYGDLDWEVVAAPNASPSSSPSPSSGYLSSTSPPGMAPSSGYLNNTPPPRISPSSGYLSSTPPPGMAPSSGYLNNTPPPGISPSSDYLNNTPLPGISPSSGYLSSTPPPGMAPSSGYLGSSSTPSPDTWGRMPAIPRTQDTSLCIPRLRVTPLPREILALLPHAYRAVLMLVDGKRSLDEIAQLLHKKPQDVQQVLTDLPNIVQM